LRTKSQPIKWTSNYFEAEKHFLTHACLSYKTEHENRKRSSEIVLQLSKTVFLLGIVHCAANSIDMQELTTVQQMANGNFVKQVVVRRIVWQYKYFFYRVIFRRSLSWMLGFNKTTVYSFGGGNRQRSREENPFTVQCMYTILITAFVYQTIFWKPADSRRSCFFWRFVN
jgi:hypothetical protein